MRQVASQLLDRDQNESENGPVEVEGELVGELLDVKVSGLGSEVLAYVLVNIEVQKVKLWHAQPTVEP